MNFLLLLQKNIAQRGCSVGSKITWWVLCLISANNLTPDKASQKFVTSTSKMYKESVHKSPKSIITENL